MKRKGGPGAPRGTKHKALTERRRASQLANAKRPKVRIPKAERELLIAKKVSALEFLRSTGIDRMRDIVENGPSDLAIRAFGVLADRCGMPIVSEQTVRMETEQPQRIIVERVGFPAPGSEPAPPEAEVVGIVSLSGASIEQ